MLVQELYRRLSLGHLSNLAIATEQPGDLTDLGKKQVVLYLNDALRNLSGRFLLSEDTALIKTQEGRIKYKLSKENSYSVQKDLPLNQQDYFIIDSEDVPFSGRVVKILNVYMDGLEVPLNVLDNPRSMYTNGDTLTIARTLIDALLGVGFQKYLDEIPENQPNLEIPIPVVLESALIYFVAGKIFQGMNAQEHLLTAKNLLNSYDQECALVESEDLLGTTYIAQLPKFNDRGFI